MKKLILIPALLALPFIYSAQQDSVLKSKKGKLILPERHDFAMGISANSVFNYLGNLLSSSGNNSLNLNLINGNQLYGKFFLDKRNALRLRANLSMNEATINNKLPSDLDASGATLVTDTRVSKNNSYFVAIGYERRRGTGRLQFLGGAEIFTQRTIQNTKMSYGNAISNFNTNPTTTNFNTTGTFNTYRVNSRTLRNNYDSGMGLGLRAFVGLEYFILPKISVGGEFGIAGQMLQKGSTTFSTESWNFSKNTVTQTDLKSTSKQSGASTDNLSGQIMVLFYFH